MIILLNYKEETIDLFSVDNSYFLVQCISADFAMGKGIAIKLINIIMLNIIFILYYKVIILLVGITMIQKELVYKLIVYLILLLNVIIGKNQLIKL